MVEPPRSKGARKEGQTTTLLADLQAHARHDWPTSSDIHNKHVGSILYQKHDSPHSSSKIEWWYINGHFGDAEEYSVFAAFFRLSYFDGSSVPRHAHAANWAFVDSKAKSYETHSVLDPATPELLSAMIDTGEYHGDEHILAAMKEMFSSGCVLQPDTLMRRPAVVSCPWEPLRLDFDGQQFRVLPCASTEALPTYEVSLSSPSVVLTLRIQPTQAAALHGKEGVVSTGHWEEDMFYYFSPQCAVTGSDGVLTRRGVSEPIAKGRFWIDHEFGGSNPRNAEEFMYLRTLAMEHTSGVEHSWEWAAIQLNNGTKDSVSVTLLKNMNDGGRVVDLFAVYQNGQTGASQRFDVGVLLTSDPTSCWKSKVTGMSFPTKWKVYVPVAGGLALTVTAVFPEQEFVTLPGKPSYWEGRVDVTGTIGQESVTGLGFMECHGERDLHAVSTLYTMMHSLFCSPLERATLPPRATTSTNEVANVVAPVVEQAALLTMMTSGQPMPTLHKDLLRALLAAYAVVVHRKDDTDAADAALSWLSGEWKRLSASVQQLDFPTLVLRAFMLRTIQHCKKVYATATGSPSVVTAPSVNAYTQPTQLMLSTPASADLLKAVDRLASGTWAVDSSKPRGSISEFLGAQGVGIVARTLCASVTPRLRTSVDLKTSTLTTDIITALSTTLSIVRLDGTSWQWESFGRGTMTSRGCAVAAPDGESCVVIVVTPVANGNIEYKWVTIRGDGTMTETMHLIDPSKPQVAKAVFEQHFVKSGV